MFFQEQTLYEAKRKSLMLGVQLINERAKALHTVLDLINSELSELRKIRPLGLSGTELETLMRRQIILSTTKDDLTRLIECLAESTSRVISEKNADYSYLFIVPNPFDAPFLKNIETELAFPYFSSPEYMQLKQTKDDLNTAQHDELAMIMYRRNVNGYLFVAGLLLALAATLAAANFIAACVNPIAGAAMIVLTSIALVTYWLTPAFNKHLESAVMCDSTIKGRINLGDESNLFSELDNLLEAYPLTQNAKVACTL